jgi:hypothetical protein
MPTVKAILSDIESRYPRATQFTHTQKIGWMNDLQRKIHRYTSIPSVQEFVASSSVMYALSTGIRFDKIDRVLVGDSTAIADISSTTIWEEYKYAGPDEALTGNQYYRPDRDTFNTTSPSSFIALHPASTEVRVCRIYYQKIPVTITATSDDTTTIPELDEEYHDLYKHYVLETVAGAGDYPDVELKNNFHADYLEEEKRVKKDWYKRKERTPKKVWSYKDW